MKRAFFIVWVLPLILYTGICSTRWVIASLSINPLVGLAALGYVLLVAGMFVLVGLLIEHPLFQLIFSIVLIVLSIVPLFVLFASHGRGFGMLGIATVYTMAFSTRNIVDCVRKSPRGRRAWVVMRKRFWSGFRNAGKRKRFISGTIACGTLLGFSATLIPALHYATGERSFTISNAEAQAYDLVVYFPDYSAINDSICNIFVDVNATLSFPLSGDRFDENDTNGELAANKTALLNSYGIPVEVWPLFEWDDGSYPSISEIDRWPTLYGKFQNWTERHNITVDYMMWDIESGGEGVNLTGLDDLPGFLWTLGYLGRALERVDQVDETWQDALETIQALRDRCHADGHQMVTTTHTIIEDIFDGDADMQKREGLPVWDAGAFDFISMMIYRGCEGGGTPPTRDYIYDYVSMSARSQPGTVAACLGCLNYTPYPNITSVVDDVRLALAAGATMIRLFQANSWIDGVGTYQASNGNWIYGGPAHGASGLRDLLEECRLGGSTSYTPTVARRENLLANTFVDTLLDLRNPF
ncbi:MAG: hypothetical protein ACTSU9_17915 [Promethearchaeota archaeon]